VVHFTILVRLLKPTLKKNTIYKSIHIPLVAHDGWLVIGQVSAYQDSEVPHSILTLHTNQPTGGVVVHFIISVRLLNPTLKKITIRIYIYILSCTGWLII